MAFFWQLARDGYHLNHGGLSGVLPLRGPTPGIRNLTLSSAKMSMHARGPLLAVRSVQAARMAPVAIAFSASSAAHRLRSSSVDVQLDESKRCPIRFQLYWTAVRPRQIDLEILVTSTNAFDRLEVLTTSEARPQPTAGFECLVRTNRWIDVSEGQLPGWLVVPRDRDAAVASLDGRQPIIDDMTLLPPCRTPMMCYRPTGQNWSYVEMSHPDDCVRTMARRVGKRVEWSFGLFGLDIEKGVILRGRVRGIFVPRRGDLRHAEREFKKFFAEPPRLCV